MSQLEHEASPEAESTYKDLEAINFELLCERLAQALTEQVGGKFSVRLTSFAMRKEQRVFAGESDVSFSISDGSVIARALHRDERRGEGAYEPDNPFDQVNHG